MTSGGNIDLAIDVEKIQMTQVMDDRGQRYAGVSNYRIGQGRRALEDLVSGATQWRLWLMFGWLDIRQRYRRAVIGPFWITISMLVMVISLGVIYSSLFKIEIDTFIPFLTAGFSIWFFISATITDATMMYISAEGIIRNATLPLSIHIFRLLWRNLLIYAHNVVVMLPVYVWFRLNPGFEVLLVIPGLILVLLNLSWMTLVVATLCARFRDTPPIVSNILQIFFFVTPILYRPNLLSTKLSLLIDLNPISHVIEVVRAPMLGSIPSLLSYLLMILFAVVGWAIAFICHRRYRSSIAYWL